MTDKEYSDLMRLLGSLTDGADNLRILFPGEGKLTDDVKSHPLFKVRWRLLTKAENDLADLIRILRECQDWTSEAIKATNVYRTLRSFLIATSDMPVGISWSYNKAHALSKIPLDLIPEKYPALYPQVIREMLEDPFYKKAIFYGDIIPPFTWTRSLKDLACWIDDNYMKSPPKDYQVSGKKKKPRRNWMPFDRVFLIDGEYVTAEQLRGAVRH